MSLSEARAVGMALLNGRTGSMPLTESSTAAPRSSSRPRGRRAHGDHGARRSGRLFAADHGHRHGRRAGRVRRGRARVADGVGQACRGDAARARREGCFGPRSRSARAATVATDRAGAAPSEADLPDGRPDARVRRPARDDVRSIHEHHHRTMTMAPPKERLAGRTLAFVLAGGRGSRLKELTDRRAKPAVYFGGKQRIVDYALSNALNSGIRKMSIATQYKAHSLIRHYQRGWSFFRAERNEYLDILPAGCRKDNPHGPRAGRVLGAPPGPPCRALEPAPSSPHPCARVTQRTAPDRARGARTRSPARRPRASPTLRCAAPVLRERRRPHTQAKRGAGDVGGGAPPGGARWGQTSRSKPVLLRVTLSGDPDFFFARVRSEASRAVRLDPGLVILFRVGQGPYAAPPGTVSPDPTLDEPDPTQTRRVAFAVGRRRRPCGHVRPLRGTPDDAASRYARSTRDDDQVGAARLEPPPAVAGAST